MPSFEIKKFRHGVVFKTEEILSPSYDLALAEAEDGMDVFKSEWASVQLMREEVKPTNPKEVKESEQKNEEEEGAENPAKQKETQSG